MTRREIAENLAAILLVFGERSTVREFEGNLESAGIVAQLPEEDEEELASRLETLLEYFPQLVDLEEYRALSSEFTNHEKGEIMLQQIIGNLSPG
jgi:hypothetical protein